MSKKSILILALLVLIFICTALLLYYRSKTPTTSSGTNNQQDDSSTYSISKQQGPNAPIQESKHPLPTFNPNVNYIKDNSGGSLSIEQKKNILTFGGNIVDLALTYDHNNFPNGQALAKYASAQGKKSLESLARQYGTATRKSQYAVIDSAKPIGLFTSPTNPTAYILSLEVFLYDTSTPGDSESPVGKAAVEIELYRANTGYEFNYIYVNPL